MTASDVIAHPSPNFGPRRDGLLPSLIVIHYTAMADAPSALARLCSEEFEVSAHYLICKKGQVYQMVEESARAWHAGAGMWRGMADINSRSIGIELDNDGKTPFSEPQMTALETLLPGIMTRWNIAPEGLIGHSDMAPTRKADPGRKFDWARLAFRGLAIWPEGTKTADQTEFATLATRFGYDMTQGEAAVLDALRQRFAPWRDGPVQDADMATLADLAARFPVEPPQNIT